MEAGVKSLFLPVLLSAASAINLKSEECHHGLKRPWWYFFCENTYKNTLKNVTTMRAGTALPLTMEKNAFACKAFPTLCCATGSVPLSCLWMNLWRLLCFIGRNTNGALSADKPFFPVPTGRNTASPAPLSFTAGKKQPVTGKGGLPADN